jgi:hypothetical protein
MWDQPSGVKQDLRFRNLGGRATLFRELSSDLKTVSVKARLTKAAEAGDMIIEHFDFEIWHQDQLIYTGNTNFGFFSLESLAVQAGIRDAQNRAYTPTRAELQRSRSHEFSNLVPLLAAGSGARAGPRNDLAGQGPSNDRPD